MRESTAREHIKQLHQARGGKLLELGEVVWIDTREYHVTPEAVDYDKQQRDADALAQILYAPDIFYCFYKSHCLLHFNYGSTCGCDSLFSFFREGISLYLYGLGQRAIAKNLDKGVLRYKTG